ncbi:prostatic acid phosphatase-like [Oppia nitens]|uniref:prostatic acid phosphatase-like n=1 Tax=Oppia nitens TaxID=1686743 RepID=UPI0023DBAFC7|nr:prostatic acid phosphatase-like [Oppia nitens]
MFYVYHCYTISPIWPNHDISTLKLLQIVHRHGDRAPISFPPNDPYKDPKYWKEGIGHLNTKGKYRMYRVGQFIRREYSEYLGDAYSPREVYARSSLSHRCIESVSTLLAGAYPPRTADWQWNNGSEAQLGQDWQPIPIETFMPKKDDIVLRQEKHCPIVYMEREKTYRAPEIQEYLKNRTQLFAKLSEIVGYPIDSVKKCGQLHTALQIEMLNGYYWSHVWSREEQQQIVDQLLDIHRMAYRIDWNSTIIKRLRAGGLVKELKKNFKSVLKETNDKKVYIYSTHDSMLATLMHALSIFDNDLPLFGSTLLFELHHNSNLVDDQYFIRIYYLRDTFAESPTPVQLGNCGNKYDCPLTEFLESTKHLIYENFKKECKNFVNHEKYIYDDKLYFIK